MNMIVSRTDAAAFADFDGHRSADNVTRREIFRIGRVAFHETFAIGIGEVTTLAAHTFGNQAACAVDAGRMKLHELHVLNRQAGAHHHRAAVARAGMCRRAEK